MTLPTFRRNPTCPKCGHDGIGFDYKAETKVKEEDYRPAASCGWGAEMHFAEHIHLVCARCGYGKAEPWVMGPATDVRHVGFRLRGASA